MTLIDLDVAEMAARHITEIDAGRRETDLVRQLDFEAGRAYGRRELLAEIAEAAAIQARAFANEVARPMRALGAPGAKSYAERRAAELEEAKPRLGDYPGRTTQMGRPLSQNVGSQ